jgi:hypothetical protein
LNHSVFIFAVVGVLLLLVLGWLFFAQRRMRPPATLNGRPEREWRHISYLPHIKQALGTGDFAFLRERGSPQLVDRVGKERRGIAIDFLQAVRSDFEKLLQLARVISAMSPSVGVARELQGFRLQAVFLYRYYWIYSRLRLGIAPSNALGHLSDMVSALTVRMEAAMSELGERAALATELAPFNGGGMDGG